MAKRKKLQDNNPPRRVEIRGQDHLLAYITPKEAQLLMDNGGSGEPGPMGIPAFAEDDGDDDVGGSVGGGIGGDDVGTAGGPSGGVGGGNDSYNDDSAAYDYSDFYTETPSQYGGASDYSLVGEAPAINQYDTNVDTLMQLNRDLQNLSRREKIAVDRMNSPMSMLPFVGLGNYLGVQNVRNLAGAMGGNPPGFFSSLGFGDRNANKFGGLDPSALAALQSNVIRDKAGNPVAFTDEYGNVKYGTDPNADYGGRDGYEEVKPVNPETGQCPEGYIFDEDLQACRLDTGGVAASSAASQAFAPGAYARMSLLDQAPQGLLQVSGQPYDFDAANKAFRMATATRPEYYSDPYDLTGYTLLA
jgi:hypothetical protein